jgi:hypothetical protein
MRITLGVTAPVLRVQTDVRQDTSTTDRRREDSRREIEFASSHATSDVQQLLAAREVLRDSGFACAGRCVRTVARQDRSRLKKLRPLATSAHLEQHDAPRVEFEEVYSVASAQCIEYHVYALAIRRVAFELADVGDGEA